MSQTLTVDPDYVEVKCPSCSHSWWYQLQLGPAPTINCPECRAPLKAPKFNIELGSL